MTAEDLLRWLLAHQSYILALSVVAYFAYSFNQPALASFGEPQNQVLYKLPTVYDDGFIRVVADTKISKSEGKSVAALVKEAIKFDMRTLSWKKDEILGKGYCVAILSSDYIKNKLHTDLGGEALELDLFAIKLETYRRDKIRFSIVVAHEITHTLVYRIFAGSNPRLVGWSRPWDEGLAQSIENRFGLAKHKKLYPSGRVKIRKGDELLNADDAQWVFQEEKLVARKKGYELSQKDQERWQDLVYPLGRQLIEFIRVDLNGQGCPDAITKIGKIIADMAKTHQTFDVEFQEKFGVDLPTVQQQFVEHLRKTQGNPEMRFKRSIFTAR